MKLIYFRSYILQGPYLIFSLGFKVSYDSPTIIMPGIILSRAGLSALFIFGLVTHICAGPLTIIVSDNALCLVGAKSVSEPMCDKSIQPLGANFSYILFKIYVFSYKRMHLKVLSEKWRPICYGLHVLTPSDEYMWQWIWPSFVQIMPRCSWDPSHLLNQCWLLIGVLVNQLNLNVNTKLIKKYNTLQNVLYQMVAIFIAFNMWK